MKWALIGTEVQQLIALQGKGLYSHSGMFPYYSYMFPYDLYTTIKINNKICIVHYLIFVLINHIVSK